MTHALGHAHRANGVSEMGVAGFEPDCESSLALGFAWFELR